MSIPIYQVDAFSHRSFAGNPAAVCLLSQPGRSEWMQKVAAEMNLSETAFLVPREDGYGLHWFTPTVEVNLCGHATLASAHVLWETGHLSVDETAHFHTISGLLKACCDGDWIELNFPAFQSETITPPSELLECIGTLPVSISRAADDTNYVVELESEEIVRKCQPDFSALARLSSGVIVTARGDDPRVDFVSRYFGSAFGIDEDPVTGSAHCVLGPYWQARLHKSNFVARQISHRGGELRVRVSDERTLIAGQAVTVLRGELTDMATTMAV